MIFYECPKCGNMISYLKKGSCDATCCGEPMKEIVPGTTDAAAEKHVPVVEKNGDVITVSVGSAEHPMLEEHYIEWIAITTKQGAQRKILKAGDAPKAVFTLCDGDEFKEAFAYCNLHKLWKS